MLLEYNPHGMASSDKQIRMYITFRGKRDGLKGQPYEAAIFIPESHIAGVYITDALFMVQMAFVWLYLYMMNVRKTL